MKTLEIYTAEWCAPCKQVKAVLSKIDLGPNVTVEIVDVEANKAKAIAASIRSVPTIILKDKEGTELNRRTGMMTEDGFYKFID